MIVRVIVEIVVVGSSGSSGYSRDSCSRYRVWFRSNSVYLGEYYSTDLKSHIQYILWTHLLGISY